MEQGAPKQLQYNTLVYFQAFVFRPETRSIFVRPLPVPAIMRPVLVRVPEYNVDDSI